MMSHDLPGGDPKQQVHMWNWDSGIQSGATTAAPSISGKSHHDVGSYPDSAQVLNEWQQEFTMEEANREQFFLFVLNLYNQDLLVLIGCVSND